MGINVRQISSIIKLQKHACVQKKLHLTQVLSVYPAIYQCIGTLKIEYASIAQQIKCLTQ